MRKVICSSGISITPISPNELANFAHAATRHVLALWLFGRCAWSRDRGRLGRNGLGTGVGHDYFYFPGDGFGYGYGLAVRTSAGEANQPGSIGELKWDSLSGTYVGIDPKLDMFYLLMEQTDNERGPIRVAFRKLVYDAFTSNDVERASNPVGR